MGSETDKFFRDRLKSFEQPPPPSAWQRVRKRNRSASRILFGLNIAAALIILVFGFWNLWKANPQEAIPQQTNDITIISPGVNEEISGDQNISAPVITEAEKQTDIQSQKGDIPKWQLPKKPVDPTKEVVVIEVSKEESNPVQQLRYQEQPIAEDTEFQQITSVTSPATVIVYSADEVNSKFLKKPKTMKPAVIKPKPTTAQKISSIATAIKHQEVGIGDLRQLKDELLAFDFQNHPYQNMNSDDK